MNSVLTRGLVAAFALSALVVGCTREKAPESTATAKAEHDMASMPGMSAPVTIPKGAIFTAADVHFMQGMQMQNWLRANGQTAPDTSSYHTMIMPALAAISK